MILKTVRTEGLAQLSYFLADESAGVAAVIDPRRDVEGYLSLARAHGVRISHILETHGHEDFISGSRELAQLTGAAIHTGPSEEIHFEHRTLRDGERMVLGGLALDALHTPGHTPEHVCYLVSGGKGAEAPWGLFAGDLLFAGDVGRTDLLGEDAADACARQLYRSLFEKVLRLGDHIEVFPLHGKGSPCGGDIGDRTSTTIGYERAHNPKLQVRDEDAFVERELAALEEAPFYYPRTRERNVVGPNLLGCLPPIAPLDPAEFRLQMQKLHTVVLDTRDIAAFGGAHIPGALNIALRKSFPLWAGWMLKPEQRVLLVLEDARDLDVVQRHLLRIGFERIEGFLAQGMPAWFGAGLPLAHVHQMGVGELQTRVLNGDPELQLVDVRRDSEWRQGRIPGAKHVFLPHLEDRLNEIDEFRPAVTYCSTGFRASIAASILKQRGFARIFNVPGSMNAWRAGGYPVEH